MKILETRTVPGLAALHLAQFGEDPLRLAEFVDTLEPGVPKELKWVLMVSTQIGCPIGCRMCDAGALGYRGNLSAQEILAQVRAVLAANPGLDPRRHPKLKIHFARMGEPALNPAVLEALELLARELPYPGVLPSLSTVAPKSPALRPFFERLLEIKDELYGGGRFQLQLSLHALDEAKRREIVPVRTWSLEEAAEYGERFVRPGDRKLTLNFALAAGESLDAGRLAAIFSPAKFLIKITPVNPTRAADAAGATFTWVEPPVPLEACAAGLRARGFDVVLSPSLPEEIAAETSCGQLWSGALKRRAAAALRARRLEAECYIDPESLPAKARTWMAELGRGRRRELPFDPASTALLVVDMQEFFTDPLSPAYLPQARALLRGVERLVRDFRRAGRPVFFARHAHEDPARDGGLMALWWRQICLEGGPGARVSARLEPRPGEVFRKCRYSAFSNPDLEPALRARGARELVVAGIVTNLCVESTVRDAFDAGFKTTVAADATAAHSEERHLASLKSLAQGFSRVLLIDDILDLLAVPAKTTARSLP